MLFDITERKRTEARKDLLTRELQHRTKNLLSVIQSIAQRSLASGRPLDDARKAFLSRLHALSHATELLSDAEWQGASMSDVIARSLDTFAGRFSIEGEHVLLNPSATQGLALVIHELCTNANKYGAYSTPGGRVAIHWSITEAGDKPILAFRWQERGGPRVVPPRHTSFGTTLLQLAIGGAETPPHIDYAPQGLTTRSRFPLPPSLRSPIDPELPFWAGASAAGLAAKPRAPPSRSGSVVADDAERPLGRQSVRHDRPLVETNCAAYDRKCLHEKE